ncbi:hypothetical protein ACQKL0_20070 [Peribacillus sp. NPDC097264]|uniref:hypothetical protein n=1 Tax=Peribacillus sp. NPDC097264 TaxID=3390616 RepID=UPI003D042CE7
MKPNEYGFYDEKIVRKSGLSVYSFEDSGDRYMPSDFWTYSDLKDVLKISLTAEERENMIVGFQCSSKQQKGFSALYSFTEVINKRYNMNAKFFAQFDE